MGGAQKYCEDLDVLCAKGPPDVEAVLSNDFLSLRMTLMLDLFPSVEPLCLHMYRSSGFSNKYEHWKTSVHFVWDGIIVNEQRAATVQHHMLRQS